MQPLVQGAGLAGSSEGPWKPDNTGRWDYTVGGILAQKSREAREGFKIGGAEVSLIFPKGLCIWRMD